MTDEKKPADPKVADDGRIASAPKITRRRFTKAGAIAPVIMTLGSRPVWGQTCSPSAVGSLTHASHVPGFDPESCTFSCPASSWYSAISWPVTAEPGHPFSGLFGEKLTCECSNPLVNNDVTALWAASLSEVLGGLSGVSSIALRDAAKEAVAAVLNAQFAAELNFKIGGDFDFFEKTPAEVVGEFRTALKADCDNCGNYNQGNSLNIFAAAYLRINSSGTCFLNR